MKKLYLSLIAVLICNAVANATSPETEIQFQKSIDRSRLVAVPQNGPQLVPNDLGGNFSSWEVLGTGHFNAELGILPECDVTVYYCTTDPNGYGTDSWYFDGIMDGVRMAGWPFMEHYNIGNNDTGRTYQGKAVKTAELSNYYSVGMKSGYDKALGKFSLAMLYYVDDPEVAANVVAYGIETVQLDGDFKDYRTSLEIAGETREGKRIKVNPSFVDATDVKVSCYNRAFPMKEDGTPGDELLSTIEAQRSDANITALTSSDPCYFDMNDDGTYTVIMTYTGENDTKGYNIAVHDYDSKWEDYGTADFTDDYLASYYNDFPIKTATGLKLQKHTGSEIYRIFNPYSSSDTWTSEWSRLKIAEPEVNSYFVINAENPEHAYIYINPIDITDGDGIRLVVGSAAHYNIINGRTEEAITEKGYWGTITKDGNTATVTFPQTTLMMRPINSEYPMFANYNNGFKAVLNGTPSGIGDITSDMGNDAPVEYYNLQGMRVDNPENGLYIRRQGTTVTKVLVK